MIIQSITGAGYWFQNPKLQVINKLCRRILQMVQIKNISLEEKTSTGAEPISWKKSNTDTSLCSHSIFY